MLNNKNCTGKRFVKVKHIIKRMLSVVLTAVMVVGMIPIVSLPVSAATNIIINGVDIGYAPGEYFAKDRIKACTCHSVGGCTDYNGPSCNCMRYWPSRDNCQVDLLGVQCLGFAHYCQWRVYGYFWYNDSYHVGNDKFTDLTDGGISKSDCTAYNLKSKLLGCSPATHVRTSDTGNHSVIIVYATDWGVRRAQANVGGRCLISVDDLSWEELASEMKGYGGIKRAMSYTEATSNPPDIEPTPTPTPDYHECSSCVSVKKNGFVTNVSTQLNVRKGPGTSYATLFQLSNNAGLTISVECNGWYYITDAGGNSGWVSSDYVKINSQEIHSHSYTDWNYEIAPPHKEYMSCSCGAYKYTGENYFDEAYYINYYEVHPHYEVKVCNVCGWDHVEKTGGTQYIDSCTTCNPPHTHNYWAAHDSDHPHREKMRCDCGDWYYLNSYYYDSSCTECTSPEMPVISIEKTEWKDYETITFSWQECKNTDYYYAMAYDMNHNRVAVSWMILSTNYEMILPAGEYYLQVASVRKTDSGEKIEIWGEPKKKITVENTFPEKPIISVSNSTPYNNETITVSWNSCKYATEYDLIVKDIDGNTVYSKYGLSGETKSHTFSLAAGEYNVMVASVNKNLQNAGVSNCYWYSAPIKIRVLELKYSIVYNANGGSGTMASSSHVYDTSKALSPNAFTRTGYTFKGWSTNSSATGATYTDKQSVKNLTSTNGGTVTLYAVWQINTYTVKFDANGGTGAPASQTKTKDVALTLSSTKPTRTGYTFKGWATTSSGNVQYASGEKYTANEAVVLYAVWETNIKYDINDDEALDHNDVKIIIDAIVRGKPSFDLTKADFNKDNKITMYDLNKLMEYIRSQE